MLLSCYSIRSANLPGAYVIIGIDLGTTNSLVAVWKNGTATIIPNSLGKPLTPSCVTIMDDDSFAVGEVAKERLQTHPAKTAAVFKRYMGTNRGTRLGGRSYRAEELSSFVLRALKADAEAYLGHAVSEAIITVPAYFSDAQRKATRIAAELAGLKVERLLNEPTAAALAYGLQTSGESKFLVFDLGGGTFDISILELFEGVMEVRASSGDNFLGGEDFSTALSDAFLEHSGLNKALGKHDHLPPSIVQRLRAIAEQAKCALSDSPSATMTLHEKEKTYSWSVTQEEFQTLAEPLLERLRQPIERALRDARIMPAELDSIILAGGATRMPIVRKLVARMFGRFPVVDLNPDELVGLGAAVQAGLKMRDAALDEVVMTDVSPYSMGIEISRRLGPGQLAQGYYMPIINRNSVVPVSRVSQAATVLDNQTMLDINIYQGESPMVKDNIYLGQLKIPVPARPAGEIKMDIRFTYDVNGLLEAEVLVLETGVSHALVVEENPGVLNPDEIRERLLSLQAIKIHPRDQTRNRTTLARAERMYQELLGPAREAVGNAIAVFQGALDQQEPARINAVHSSVLALLEQLELAPKLIQD
ncbi:molecular chaperone HscC [Collimonas pratensis]|uniref:Hsp70 family protein n=1 Tax=Collimonas pratensis TaxID=279113 RepID=UPI0009ED7105|nr:molecular chaperone HscC [Collimonas pratensis]